MSSRQILQNIFNDGIERDVTRHSSHETEFLNNEEVLDIIVYTSDRITWGIGVGERNENVITRNKKYNCKQSKTTRIQAYNYGQQMQFKLLNVACTHAIACLTRFILQLVMEEINGLNHKQSSESEQRNALNHSNDHRRAK